MRHLIFGLAAGTTISLILYYLLQVSGNSLQLLILFNFLFVSAFFPLNGSLKRKMFLLLTGNFIGLLWNNLLYLFTFSATEHFGGIFSILYLILSPFLNLFWIVSFFSISLTYISPSKSKKGGIANAY